VNIEYRSYRVYTVIPFRSQAAVNQNCRRTSTVRNDKTGNVTKEMNLTSTVSGPERFHLSDPDLSAGLFTAVGITVPISLPVQ